MLLLISQIPHQVFQAEQFRDLMNLRPDVNLVQNHRSRVSHPVVRLLYTPWLRNSHGPSSMSFCQSPRQKTGTTNRLSSTARNVTPCAMFQANCIVEKKDWLLKGCGVATFARAIHRPFYYRFLVLATTILATHLLV